MFRDGELVRHWKESTRYGEVHHYNGQTLNIIKLYASFPYPNGPVGRRTGYVTITTEQYVKIKRDVFDMAAFEREVWKRRLIEEN